MARSDTSLSQTPTPPPPPSMPLFFGSARSRSSLPVIQADLKEIGLYLGGGGGGGRGSGGEGDGTDNCCRDLCLQCEHLAAKNQVDSWSHKRLAHNRNQEIVHPSFHVSINL